MGSLIGIAIIAKDEENRLPNLLKSIDGAFDRAVLLDTGSTDGTIDVFSAWARSQPEMTYSVASWEWSDDFSDARNACDRLLLFGSPLPGNPVSAPMVDWRSWADCDDVVAGAGNLRSIASNARPEVTAFFAGYNYAQDPDTNQTVVYLKRERLVRATYSHPWIGRVHEAVPILEGAIMHLPPETVEWVHQKQLDGVDDAIKSNNRNIDILVKWNTDEPNTPRIVGYIGTELMVQGKHVEAIPYFNQYISLDSDWDEERAQMHRKLCQCLMVVEKENEAIDVALDALRVAPTWPDSYLTLAEAMFQTGEFKKSLEWCERVIELGVPDTMLIVNPLDYTWLPYKIKALSLSRLGDTRSAAKVAEQALMRVPSDPMLREELQRLLILTKRENTAETYCMVADQLIAHDEQLKALTLLEDCVPHFACEHPAITQKRSWLRERLLWLKNDSDFAEHYESGGSKPEDFIPDDRVDALCEALPRTQFLLRGLVES